MSTSLPTFRNRVLDDLKPDDLASFSSHLEPVSFGFGRC